MRFVALNRISMALAAIGVFISGVLTLAELTDKDVPCGGGSGCAVVANDISSHFLGIPTAAIGVAGYLAILSLGLWRSISPNVLAQAKVGLALTVGGYIASFGLLAYSLLVLHTTCLWCVASVITMLFATVAQLMAGNAHREKVRPDWVFAGVLVVLASGGVFLQSRFLHRDESLTMTKALVRKLNPEELWPTDSNILGHPKAPLTLVEFADFACNACHEIYPKIERLLAAAHGRIRLVFHNLPLGSLEGHQDSREAAILAEMASQSGHFWDFADGVYGLNKTASLTEYRGIYKKVTGFAKGDREKAIHSVDQDLTLAKKLHIGQTPTFIILGQGLPAEVTTNQTLSEVLKRPEYQKLLTGA